MFGDEANKEIKIASDNTIKNGLINFDVDFSGLKDAVALFFPSIRDEIVLRYRAETIARIGIEAYRLAIEENIKINPIPPKIALPLIEKMSLEHEPDMYERWAKLLIAAGVNSNPIHQQYADILSNLDNKNAELLKIIYEKQASPDIEKEYEEDINKSMFQKCYDELQRHSSWRSRSSLSGEDNYSLPDSFGAFHSLFRYPLILHGTEKSAKTYVPFIVSYKEPVKEYSILVFSKEINNDLIGLEKLGLIKHNLIFREQGKDKNEESVFIERYGILLTQFGYNFVDCLENPTK